MTTITSFSTGSELPRWIIDTSRRYTGVSTPSPYYDFAKRTTDIALIVIFSPLLLLLLIGCICLIKLESPHDSIFFKQLRTGKNGKRFAMYKFRTMVTNSEELKMQIQHLNELAWPDFKVTNDPRITRLGRILRKTSLDELPQLYNVLSGEMSLVGPRPTSFSASTYLPWQTVRLEVLPGLTGLWQILGRGDMEFDERVRLDYEYIVRRSYLLDLMLILNTFKVLGSGK